MAISMIPIECPKCGATFQGDNSREFLFCQYCGAKVMLHNENEYVYHTIDEAEIKRAEMEKAVKMRQLEMKEKSGSFKKVMIVVWIIAMALLVIVGIIGSVMENEGMMICFLFAVFVAMFGAFEFMSSSHDSNDNTENEKKEKAVPGPDEIAITGPMTDWYGKNYNAVYLLFTGVGFTNVTVVPLKDLNGMNKNKDEQVDVVTINGSDEFDEGDIYKKDAYILITYHSR